MLIIHKTKNNCLSVFLGYFLEIIWISNDFHNVQKTL